jgi:uncharacterized protein (TIGR03546 family)
VLALKILASFFKALNEKASPRAIAGGLALGAIIGLTPKGSFHNAFVVMLIFLLPVNKSASLVSAGIFTLCSYLGDPLFNAIGEALLTASALAPLWTSLYNTPVIPWTRFQQHPGPGKPSFFLVHFLPPVFGNCSVCGGVPRTGRGGGVQVEDSPGSPGLQILRPLREPLMIRWGRLAVLLTPIVLIWAGTHFFLDRTIKNAIETVGTKAVGAKVDVGNVSTSFWRLSAKISDLAVTDPDQPMTNAVEIKALRLKAQLKPLFWKKVIVERAEITGIRTGTPRKRSGAIAVSDSTERGPFGGRRHRQGDRLLGGVKP